MCKIFGISTHVICIEVIVKFQSLHMLHFYMFIRGTNSIIRWSGQASAIPQNDPRDTQNKF